MSKKNLRSRGYAFTSFLLDKKEYYLERSKELGASYIVIGNETCPKTGRLHLQGYVYFPNRPFWNSLKKELFVNDEHFDPARKCLKANERYCKQDGDFIEWKSKDSMGGAIESPTTSDFNNREILAVMRHLRDKKEDNVKEYLWCRKCKDFATKYCSKDDVYMKKIYDNY